MKFLNFNKLFLLFFIGIFFLFFIRSSPALAQSVKLQIPVPDLNSTVQTCSGAMCSGIGLYIAAFAKWLITAISMLAVLFMMIGGIIWLTSRSSQKQVAFARKLIWDSLMGLGLALGSTLLLGIINPSLVTFEGLGVGKIDKIDFIAPNPEPYLDGGSGEGPGTVDLGNVPPNIYCPKKGGTGEIQKISLSLKEKVAYRFGGKGKNPPPDYDEFQKKLLKYKNFCPLNNICLDCSGFVNFVRNCAGLRSVGSTAAIFPTKPINSSKGELLGRAGGSLQPGDLVGNIKGDAGHKLAGHVWMYIGNDIQGNPTFAESSGRFEEGRQPNKNPVYSKGTDDFFKGKRFARP